jgi:hypothetical protein
LLRMMFLHLKIRPQKLEPTRLKKGWNVSDTIKFLNGARLVVSMRWAMSLQRNIGKQEL